jgi:hypothetical protein
MLVAALDWREETKADTILEWFPKVRWSDDGLKTKTNALVQSEAGQRIQAYYPNLIFPGAAKVWLPRVLTCFVC